LKKEHGVEEIINPGTPNAIFFNVLIKLLNQITLQHINEVWIAKPTKEFSYPSGWLLATTI
jgi:hypothetical protein